MNFKDQFMLQFDFRLLKSFYSIIPMKTNGSIFTTVIKKCNFFTAPVNFRYQMESVYNTVAGGCISIGLIIMLIGVFFSSWMELLNKQSITAVTQTIRQFDPEKLEINTNDFMFAIGISYNDITNNAEKRYFDIVMEKWQKINATSSRSRIQMVACTQQHWKGLGQKFVQIYHRQKLKTFYCPPLNYTLQLKGKFTSEQFLYYRIITYPCRGTNCYSQAQFDAYIAKSTSFNFNFYYSNNLLNPQKRQPLSKFFDDKDYSMISSKLGAFVNLYMSEFQMETDESLLPFEQPRKDSGYIMNRGQKEDWDYVPLTGGAYCKYYLRKSSIKYEINRRFRKIDQMLSYIGGLLGLVTVAFGIILNYYGQCSYELQMCQKVFDYKKSDKNEILSNESQIDQQNNKNTQQQKCNDAETIHPNKFNIFDYFMYLIYRGITMIFAHFKWQRMEIYANSLQQIRHKLDMGQLIQKMAFYDRAFNSLFDDDQLKLLYLQQKFNFDEVREQRDLWEMRKTLNQENLLKIQLNNEKQLGGEIGPTQIRRQRLSMQQNNRRFRSFLGETAIHPQQVMVQDPNNKGLQFSAQIKRAIKNLQQKIENGDMISARIYNGLKQQILDAYERQNKESTRKILKLFKKQPNKKLAKIPLAIGIKLGQNMDSPMQLESGCDSINGLQSPSY